MLDVILLFVLHPTPLWVALVLTGALAFLLWRVHVLSRIVEEHAQSIGNMDEWADITDDRLERLDWSRNGPPNSPSRDRPRSWGLTG